MTLRGSHVLYRYVGRYLFLYGEVHVSIYGNVIGWRLVNPVYVNRFLKSSCFSFACRVYSCDDIFCCLFH